MANGQAVGLEQVGGVHRGTTQNDAVQDTRTQRSRAGAEMANNLQATNFGPEMRARVSGKLTQASAQVAGARNSTEYNIRKIEGERTAVRGHEEATQVQAPYSSQSETAFGSLNRAI